VAELDQFLVCCINDKEATDWHSLIEIYQNIVDNVSYIFTPAWIFRGQSDSKFGFLTSFERRLIWANRNNLEDKQQILRFLSEIMKPEHGVICYKSQHKSIREIELGIIREFQRKCHHFTDERDLPDEDDMLEWLALMRHYEAPVHLLDWTYSFFVAVYFALENADDCCAVWALDSKWLFDMLKRDDCKVLSPMQKRILRKDKYLKDHNAFDWLLRKNHSFVCPFTPRRLNQRLTIQQGTLLFSGNIREPFESNMVNMFQGFKNLKTDEIDKIDHHFYRISINIDPINKREIIQNLYRMNITRASLFPGLDGFAQSLRTAIAMPERIGLE
jgi:hypothetical protein